MWTASRETVQHAVDLRIRECSFHPVRDQLRSTPWDGAERLTNWMSTYLGVPSNEYSQGIGRMLVMGTMIKAMDACSISAASLMGGAKPAEPPTTTN